MQVVCKFSLALHSMNTNIVLSLDTRRSKKDGSFPLVMRLGHNRRTTSIPTGISLKEKDWDEKNRLVRKSYQGVDTVTRLNNLLQKKKSEAMDVIVKLDEDGDLKAISVADLKNRLHQASDSQSFFTFTEQLIEELKRANRFGTARSYNCVYNVVRKFNQNRDLTFKGITYSFLSNFETSHTSKGNTANGLGVYMRTIRAIYNKAIKSALVEKDLYPFQVYKIKSIPTEKRALEWESLKKIIELELGPEHPCFNARNYFVASYMMYGMNFSDLAYLKKTDLQVGRILYRRRKTGKLYDIKVSDQLKAILDHYLASSRETEYIFPILKREKPEQQDKDIQWARKRYNKKLKRLATSCSIEKNLTSYVSRHSFATQAMLQQVPINAISSMLGHSSLKTTEIYLKALPNNILDDYNAKIMEGT